MHRESGRAARGRGCNEGEIEREEERERCTFAVLQRRLQHTESPVQRRRHAVCGATILIRRWIYGLNHRRIISDSRALLPPTETYACLFADNSTQLSLSSRAFSPLSSSPSFSAILHALHPACTVSSFFYTSWDSFCRHNVCIWIFYAPEQTAVIEDCESTERRRSDGKVKIEPVERMEFLGFLIRWFLRSDDGQVICATALLRNISRPKVAILLSRARIYELTILQLVHNDNPIVSEVIQDFETLNLVAYFNAQSYYYSSYDELNRSSWNRLPLNVNLHIF